MARFYDSKKAWANRDRRERVDARSSSTRSTVKPVLEMDRSPSGEYVFSSDIYTPPTNSGGRYKGQSTPKAGSAYHWSQGYDNGPETHAQKQFKQWSNMNRLKQRLAGFSSKANLVQAMAQFAHDPEAMQEAMDYGWDDFMEGRLPPPFDWLNAPVPEAWKHKQEKSEPVDQDKVWVAFPPNNAYFVAIPLPPGFDKSMFFPNAPNNGFVYTNDFPPLQNLFPDPIGFGPPFFVPGGWTQHPGQTNTAGFSGPDDWPSKQNPTASGAMFWLKDYVNGLHWTGYSIRQGNRPTPVPRISPWPTEVGLGFSEAEARANVPARVVVGEGWSMMPDLFRPTVPNYRLPEMQLLGTLNGTYSSFTPAVDWGTGSDSRPGTVVTVPPRGPIIKTPVKPGEPPHKPPPGTKEKKGRVGAGFLQAAQNIFHAITEYGDLVDALYDAIPKKYQCKTKSLVGKTACLFAHVDKIDVGDAIVNIAWNQFEDYVIGKGLFAVNQKAAAARGDRYGFRTLNSVNGFGGLEDLGELYGDFSKQYVNPSKDDLKRYLSTKFGI